MATSAFSYGEEARVACTISMPSSVIICSTAARDTADPTEVWL